MKTLEQLLKRHGFKVEDSEVNGHYGEFLAKAFGKLNVENAKRISEQEWMNCLQAAEQNIASIGREGIIDPEIEELPLASIDPYIRGAVRWLNEYGVRTTFSCDGHDKRAAYVCIKKSVSLQQMEVIALCAPDGLTVNYVGNKLFFHYKNGKRELLLDFAERLYNVIFLNMEEYYKREKFKEQLLYWLHIPGRSGNEQRIRMRLKHVLDRTLDFTYVDRKGNLLGIMDCGDGPTILLSAHMDLSSELVPGREIIEDGTVLSSSEGILGADDRAGIAAILEILSRVRRTNFCGKLKIAFTVEEEIGSVGAQNIEPSFLADVDGAIVLDRRGTRDIVVSCGISLYAPASYGTLFEKAGKLVGMNDWRMTAGGISDARVYAEHGIPSVNLSVGYANEHTADEFVDYAATYETTKLVTSVLHHNFIQKRVLWA